MTTRHCVHHPSRAAPFLCRACGKPLCELCASVHLGHVYCGWSCALPGTARTIVRTAVRLLALPVPAPWSLGIVACAAALLLAAVGTHTARLLELSVTPSAPSAAVHPSRPVRARLLPGRRGPILDITGPPHAAVLVISDQRARAVIELGADGRGRLEDLDASARADRLRVFLLGRSPSIPVVPPTETPTPTATARPSPTPPPPPTPTATAAPSPTPTATPSPTPALRSRTSEPTPATVPWPPLTPPGPSLDAPPSADRRPTATPTHAPTRPPRHRPSRSTGAPPVLELVRDAGSRISLTFDGGSKGNGADEILDRLAELDVRATLFLTGRFIRTHPQVVRRAVLEGHEVGNHTLTHPHLTTWADNRRHDLLPSVDRDAFQAELLGAERLFLQTTGRPMAPLWRAPYGEENASLRRWAAQLGYLHVRWSRLPGASLDSRDWVASEHSPLYEDTDAMVARLLDFPELDGGIVLLHLGSHRTEPAWERLPALVDGLRGRDLDIVPVTELLDASPAWRPHLRAAAERHRSTVRRLRGESAQQK